ncbi:MAG: hypothetical protein CL663_01275 [Bacteroidetes bacterium]|nr:hypothetical protein [Bacteroidota bacterium]
MIINSRYNILFKDKSFNYAFNSLSGSLIKITKNQLLFLQEGKNANSLDLSNSEQRILIENGFLIEDNFNELEFLEKNFRTMSKNPYSAIYTLYLSMKCNLACPYCIEKSSNKTINEIDLEILERFIVNQLSTINNVLVVWSGGEPLLYWEKIKKLSKTFKSNSRKPFYSRIVTNGVLLTEEIARELPTYNIKHAQITLDGPPEIHDTSRIFKSKKGSFNQVLQGIINASKYIKVTIRINIDSVNAKHIPRLLELLNSSDISKENVILSFKPIVPGYNTKDTSNLLSNRDFSIIEIELYKQAKKYNFPTSLYTVNPNSVRCAYFHNNSFNISPDLKLYRCSEQIEETQFACGKIDEDSNIKLYRNVNKLETYDPYEDEECKRCKALPLCMGKCPITINNKNCNHGDGCVPHKFNTCERVLLQNNIEYNDLLECAENPLKSRCN